MVCGKELASNEATWLATPGIVQQHLCISSHAQALARPLAAPGIRASTQARMHARRPPPPPTHTCIVDPFPDLARPQARRPPRSHLLWRQVGAILRRTQHRRRHGCKRQVGGCEAAAHQVAVRAGPSQAGLHLVRGGGARIRQWEQGKGIGAGDSGKCSTTWGGVGGEGWGEEEVGGGGRRRAPGMRKYGHRRREEGARSV